MNVSTISPFTVKPFNWQSLFQEKFEKTLKCDLLSHSTIINFLRYTRVVSEKTESH